MILCFIIENLNYFTMFFKFFVVFHFIHIEAFFLNSQIDKEEIDICYSLLYLQNLYFYYFEF